MKELGGPTSYADSGSAGGSKISFKDAFRAARKQGLDTFTWQGKKYTTEMKDKEDKAGAKTESRKMSSEEFVKEYEKAPASGRMRQEAYYRANPEPSAEAVNPEEAIFGPKAKAAAAGAGAAAAGYGLKKARDFLMRRGQKARSEAADVAKGDFATARSAAAREKEAAAYAERIKNARRSPGMTGYKKGGMVKSSASRRADGIAQRGKTKGRFV
jgi:hypothetical protein